MISQFYDLKAVFDGLFFIFIQTKKTLSRKNFFLKTYKKILEKKVTIKTFIVRKRFVSDTRSGGLGFESRFDILEFLQPILTLKCGLWCV